MEQEDIEKNIAVEVRKAKRDYLTALSSVDIAENQAKLAKEGLSLVEISYKAGTGSSLELTDAMNQVSGANLNVITKKLEAQIALLKLLYAVGKDMTLLE